MAKPKTVTPDAPVTPDTPDTPVTPDAPDTPVTPDAPVRKITVKHKKSGNTFEVSKDYYQRNKAVLDRI